MNKRDKTKRDRAKQPAPTGSDFDETWQATVLLHLRVGWWSLLIFLTLGIVLEMMHGFKVQWYVGEENATRRLMGTLAHAHGTLLSLVHLAYAATIHYLASASPYRAIRSWCLCLATFLIPLGFLTGGIVVYDGDPGVGILLVPVGAGLLFITVLITASSVTNQT